MTIATTKTKNTCSKEIRQFLSIYYDTIATIDNTDDELLTMYRQAILDELTLARIEQEREELEGNL